MLKGQVNYAGGGSIYALPNMEQSLGDRIKFLRDSRKLTQEQLGAALDVSGASVSQWENGATKDLKIENFLRFCAYFNCDPQWLAFGDSPPDWLPSSNSRQNTAK